MLEELGEGGERQVERTVTSSEVQRAAEPIPMYGIVLTGAESLVRKRLSNNGNGCLSSDADGSNTSGLEAIAWSRLT